MHLYKQASSRIRYAVIALLLCQPALAASDTDSDGVDDLLDNCVQVSNGPATSGLAAANIQLDSDKDGFGNLCDADSGQPPGPGSEAPCQPGPWPTACAFHGDNAYDWDVWVDHPDCSASTSDTLHITQNSDWNQVNDPNYRVFCVHPGDYRSWSGSTENVLTLTLDGTSTAPRWIVLYDPEKPLDRTHPVLLPDADRAIMPHFRIESSDHWKIVRMTVREYGCVNSTGICGVAGAVRGTRGTRFSHMLIEDGKKSAFPWVVRDASGVSNGNYIFQYIVHRNIEPTPAVDRVAFYFEDCAEQPCVMVRNEIYNPAADAVQVAGDNYHGGIRIDENEMYMTDARRTDCAGVYQLDGNCTPNEVMIVFKDPRTEPATESYITNNVIHHSYESDGIACCSQSGVGAAHAIYIGSGPNGPLTNVIIENNVIYASSGGISFQWHQDNDRGAKAVQVYRNLLSDIRPDTAFHTWAGQGHVESRNVIVDTNAYIGTTSYLGSYKTHRCNVAIDGGIVNPAFGISGGSWGDNYAYGNTVAVSGTGYTESGARADAAHESLCVVSSFITNPTHYCIAGGKVDPVESPHADCGQTDLRVTQSVGANPVIVNDNIVYTSVVTNDGPSTATGVSLSNSIPAGTTFVSVSTSQGSCTGTSTIACTLGTLAVNASATVVLTVNSSGPGNPANTVQVDLDQFDADLDDNSASATTSVVPVCAGGIYTLSGGTSRSDGTAITGAVVTLFRTTPAPLCGLRRTVIESGRNVGNYQFSKLSPATYTFSAYKAGCTWAPPSRTWILTKSKGNQHFVSDNCP